MSWNIPVTARAVVPASKAADGQPGSSPDNPDIVIPKDWRFTIAGLNREQWHRWRARSSELLAGLGRDPTVQDIRAADRVAAIEQGIK